MSNPRREAAASYGRTGSRHRSRRPSSPWLVVAIAVLLVLAGFGLKTIVEEADAPQSHAEYLRDAYTIVLEYVKVLDDVKQNASEDGAIIPLAIAAERVVVGPEDLQTLLAFGAYDEARARLRSMRRDLEELKAYAASL